MVLEFMGDHGRLTWHRLLDDDTSLNKTGVGEGAWVREVWTYVLSLTLSVIFFLHTWHTLRVVWGGRRRAATVRACNICTLPSWFSRGCHIYAVWPNYQQIYVPHYLSSFWAEVLDRMVSQHTLPCLNYLYSNVIKRGVALFPRSSTGIFIACRMSREVLIYLGTWV